MCIYIYIYMYSTEGDGVAAGVGGGLAAKPAAAPAASFGVLSRVVDPTMTKVRYLVVSNTLTFLALKPKTPKPLTT